MFNTMCKYSKYVKEQAVKDPAFLKRTIKERQALDKNSEKEKAFIHTMSNKLNSVELLMKALEKQSIGI